MVFSKGLAALWLLLASPASAASLRRDDTHSPAAIATGRDGAPMVTVRNGTYSGVYSAKYHQEYFLGMPYAQKPARFTVAESLNSTWQGPRKATSYPRHCVGFGGDMVGYEMDEDCLYLNVIRPAGINPSAELPVAVWIHGGGLFMGGSGDRRYNLSFIVQNSVELGTPIIGVSLNYRLSAFGFLSGSEVRKEGATNIGFRDQRLALQWVKENIASFGGSPDKVTIWGESSGAESVSAQVLAYNGRDDGLFRGAVAQSGFGGPLHRYPGGLNATGAQQAAYDRLVKMTSCASLVGTPASLGCLRSLPVSDLMTVLANNSLAGSPWPPVLDGDFIADYPSRQLREGKFPRIPILVGENSGEGSGFGMGKGEGGKGINTNEEMAASVIKNIIGVDHPNRDTLVKELLFVYPNIQAVGVPTLEKFPALTPDVPEAAFLGLQYRRSAAVYGDALMHYQRRRATVEWSKHGVPAYSYRFDVTNVGTPGYISAAHFMEVIFVFYNLNAEGYASNPFQNAPKSHKDLAKTMSNTWVRFFAGLDPNGGKTSSATAGSLPVQWPAYDVKSGGGVGKAIVWDAVKGPYVEWDDLRAEGINWMIENSFSVMGT